MKRIFLYIAAIGMLAATAFAAIAAPPIEAFSVQILQSIEMAEVIPWLAVISAAVVASVLSFVDFGPSGVPDKRTSEPVSFWITLKAWLTDLFKPVPDHALSGGDGRPI